MALRRITKWLSRQRVEILIIFGLALLGGACGWLLRDQLMKRGDDTPRDISYLQARLDARSARKAFRIVGQDSGEIGEFPIVQQSRRVDARRGGEVCAGEGGHVERTIDLIEAEIPRLRRYARYLAREADRADDLVQECLTRAISKIDSWTPGTNLRAWLFVILRNCHINEVRRGQRTSLIGEMSSDYDVVPTPASQEAHMSLLEVRNAYLNLSEEHREVLLLVAIEGLQYEEAAGILQIPVGTIRSRLSRARQTLRDALDDRAITPRGPLSPAKATRHG